MQSFLVITLILSTASIVYTQPPSLQHASLESSNQFRANEIKNAFLYAFKGYKKYAWGHDEVQPVTNTTSDNYNGWGVTIVDSLDTMIIMGIEYNDSREFIKNLEFTVNNGSTKINVFETVIRYLGGLLSAYELTKDDLFLNKSIKLGNVLLPAFDTPTGIPMGMVDLVKKKGVHGGYGRNSVLADIGTLQLEFRRLSELSRNSKYLKKAQKVIDVLQRKSTELPGLYPVFIDPYTGNFTTTWVTWGGLGDSFYEYLLKQHIMIQGKTSQYIDMWMSAVKTTMEKLVYTAKGFPNLTYLAQWKNGKPFFEMGHLACFAGGNFLLAGKFLNNTSLTNLGLNVTATCYNTYIGTNTMISPEGFGWISPNSSYILRPEVVESIFYAYRVTRDPKYQDWAWNIFKSINKFCKTSTGFSGLNNVTSLINDWNNSQQSFFFAETLKYLYLIFSNTSLISLDEWVFNTEAHPIRIGGG
ncbi:4464_t:CDS:2 [Dentiscutata erythropus]|uniref:alpha-1,2-Mannosidase n=1 Tax=Dentiscutata erythropus TaxID=1348616 RepID=A0A9N8VZT9_9GLOM|nr:4464_t:CDS:2 [Dentiscutata erythropus]